MALLSSPFPYDVPVSPETIDRDTGRKVRSPYLAQEIIDWLLEQQGRTDTTAQQIGSLTPLTAQGASIAATPIPMPDLSAGRYGVSYYARITRAGSVSSSLIVTIGWTDGGVSCTRATTALTTNTTASTVSGVVPLRSAANAPITIATTYADGGGATSMQYSLDAWVVAIPN